MKLIGIIKSSETKYVDFVETRLLQQEDLPLKETNFILNALKDKGLEIDLTSGKPLNSKFSKIIASVITSFITHGQLSISSSPRNSKLDLFTSSPYFNINEHFDFTLPTWKVSRFSYIHQVDDNIIIRNPKAFCYLIARDPVILEIFYKLALPTNISHFRNPAKSEEKEIAAIFSLLIRAKIILSTNCEQKTEEEENLTDRQWDFHDLLFHSLSRIGRTEKNIGGSFRFKGIIAPQPIIKDNPWKNNAVIKLPIPNLYNLNNNDITLTNAIETRRSVRSYSIIPLSINQLGEFLYRTVRIRYEISNEWGNFVSKPYPSGGAIYETELYITINACSGTPRGFYYYDSKNHALFLITNPNIDTEALINEAFYAAGGQDKPHVLITLASRFNRFNWKYSSMSYAAQLKNIGVIYQTMYLVSTSMKIGGCAIGTGNTDRFCRMTDMDYLQEGSIGEFMLGNIL